MSLRKEAVSQMNKRNELLIYGYFRQLNGTNSTFSELLPHICAAFYLIADEWDLKRKHDPIILTQDNTVIHHDGKQNENWNSIFGKQVCKNGERYQWTLKIVQVSTKTPNSWKILVGIINDKQCDSLLKREAFYRYFTSLQDPLSFGFIGSEAGITTRGAKVTDYGEKFEKQGDSIIVDLDMRNDKHSLSFVINDEEYGKAFDVGKDETYRLAVSVCKGRKVKLCDVEYTDSPQSD